MYLRVSVLLDHFLFNYVSNDICTNGIQYPEDIASITKQIMRITVTVVQDPL